MLEIARRIGRARGYAGWHWAHTRERWGHKLRLVRRVGLIWVAVTVLLAAIRLWQQW